MRGTGNSKDQIFSNNEYGSKSYKFQPTWKPTCCTSCALMTWDRLLRFKNPKSASDVKKFAVPRRELKTKPSFSAMSSSISGVTASVLSIMKNMKKMTSMSRFTHVITGTKITFPPATQPIRNLKLLKMLCYQRMALCIFSSFPHEAILLFNIYP